jgi:hypothetical protein
MFWQSAKSGKPQQKLGLLREPGMRNKYKQQLTAY